MRKNFFWQLLNVGLLFLDFSFNSAAFYGSKFCFEELCRQLFTRKILKTHLLKISCFSFVSVFDWNRVIHHPEKWNIFWFLSFRVQIVFNKYRRLCGLSSWPKANVLCFQWAWTRRKLMAFRCLKLANKCETDDHNYLKSTRATWLMSCCFAAVAGNTDFVPILLS